MRRVDDGVGVLFGEFADRRWVHVGLLEFGRTVFGQRYDRIPPQLDFMSSKPTLSNLIFAEFFKPESFVMIPVPTGVKTEIRNRASGTSGMLG